MTTTDQMMADRRARRALLDLTASMGALSGAVVIALVYTFWPGGMWVVVTGLFCNVAVHWRLCERAEPRTEEKQDGSR